MSAENMNFEPAALGATPLQSVPAAVSVTAPAQGFDVQKFIDAHRIHIDRSSYITPDLAIHPSELNPRNEATLRAKLKEAFTTDSPSIFGDEKRTKIMNQLGELIPLSLEAEQDIHARRGQDLANFENSGENVHAAHLKSRMEKPYSSMLNQWKATPQPRTYETEKQSNALAMYLMVEMAANKPETPRTAAMQRDFKELFRYEGRSEAGLANFLGIKDIIPAEVMRTALTPPSQGGGIAGVGKELGLTEAEIQEVVEITDYAAQHQFAENVVENWKAGRKIDAPNPSAEDTIKNGVNTRIDTLINEQRQRVGERYEVSSTVKAQEQEFAAGIALLPPVLQETLFELGAEFVRTPEASLERITGKKGLLGQHRTRRNGPNDYGRHMILISEARASKEGFLRTLVHECFHTFLPQHLTAADAEKVDALYAEDAARLNGVKEVMEQCFRGEISEAQTIDILNEKFSVGNLTLEAALGPNPDLNKLYYQVQDAHANLHTDSMNYARGGYPSPESKTNEIMSRYSEQHHVTMRDNPALAAWLNPGVTEAHDTIYLPHLEQGLEAIKARNAHARPPEHKLMDHLSFSHHHKAPSQENAAQHTAQKTAANENAAPTKIAANMAHDGMVHGERAASVAL